MTDKNNINKVTKCHGTLASLSRSVGNEDVEQLWPLIVAQQSCPGVSRTTENTEALTFSTVKRWFSHFIKCLRNIEKAKSAKERERICARKTSHEHINKRPESSTPTLSSCASNYKVQKLHQRYMMIKKAVSSASLWCCFRFSESNPFRSSNSFASEPTES